MKGRIAVIIPAYAGKMPKYHQQRLLGLFLNMISMYWLRQFVAQRRDFTAAPKPFPFMIQVVADILQHEKVDHVSIFADSSFVPRDFIPPSWVESFKTTAIPFWIPDLSEYDDVLIAWPDAIGIGQHVLEKRIKMNRCTPPYVVSGRRRFFSLDEDMQRRLNWRRALARTRLADFFIGAIILPSAGILAVVDAFRGKR